jgi:hypothetical protein
MRSGYATHAGCGTRLRTSTGIRCPACLGGLESPCAERQALNPRDLASSSHSSLLPGAEGTGCALDNIRSAWNVGSILRSADGSDLRMPICAVSHPHPTTKRCRKPLGARSRYLVLSQGCRKTIRTEAKAGGVPPGMIRGGRNHRGSDCGSASSTSARARY